MKTMVAALKYWSSDWAKQLQAQAGWGMAPSIMAIIPASSAAATEGWRFIHTTV